MVVRIRSEDSESDCSIDLQTIFSTLGLVSPIAKPIPLVGGLSRQSPGYSCREWSTRQRVVGLARSMVYSEVEQVSSPRPTSLAIRHT